MAKIIRLNTKDLQNLVKKIIKEEKKTSLKNSCWKGYEAIGFKKKNGKKVPNCVPITENSLKEERTGIENLFNHGIRVFGNREKFKQWLDTPNFYFGEESPRKTLLKKDGIKLIDDRLTAMEYGDNV